MSLTYLIILILALPTLYGIREMIKEKQIKSKQLRLAKVYDKLVSENKLSVEHLDMFEYKVIALDRKNKNLLFIDHTEGNKQELCISLLQIASCRIVKERDVHGKYIKKLFLELKNRRNNRLYKFCFFDESKNSISDLPALSRQASLWKHRVKIHSNPGNISLEQEYVF
jgi:hypothetical protein